MSSGYSKMKKTNIQCHYDIHMKAFLTNFNDNNRVNSYIIVIIILFLSILMDLEQDKFLFHASFVQGYI